MTKYTVVGAGAIGGTLAVHLHRAGADVQIVDADEAHVRAIAERGLRVEQPGGAIEARIPVMTPENAPEKLDAVLLAVKAQATDAVAAWIAPRLADDGWVASLQNGLNEPVIARHVGADRTVAAFVDLFADVIEPGVVRDGGAGDIALGEYSGGDSTRVRRLAQDLSEWGTPIVSGNIPGFLWSKLGFGAMLVASALVDDDMGDLIDRHRIGMHALTREVLQVARAEQIALEAFDAFTPHDYLGTDVDANRATDALVAWLATQSKKRSGIWRDIAVRGRKTEVPAQYAAVFAAAERHEIATPTLRWLVTQIERLETHQIAMDESLLHELDGKGAA